MEDKEKVCNVEFTPEELGFLVAFFFQNLEEHYSFMFEAYQDENFKKNTSYDSVVKVEYFVKMVDAIEKKFNAFRHDEK